LLRDANTEDPHACSYYLIELNKCVVHEVLWNYVEVDKSNKKATRLHCFLSSYTAFTHMYMSQ
jgi:hypothetical protein